MLLKKEEIKIGQAEILKILEKNKGKWLSTIEIRLKLNQNSSVITKALNQMFKYKEVERKELPITEDSERYVFFWCIK